MPMAAVPALDGVQIFGRAVQMSGASLARATQRMSQAGVNGVAQIDLGYRGRQTKATGLLYAVSPAALFNWTAIWELYRDGRAHELLDNYGNTWTGVVLDDFQYAHGIKLDPKWGWHTPYAATFFHLI